MHPSTYVPTFHGDIETHPWLSKLQYNELGATKLPVSLISYGGSSFGNFYGEVDQKEGIETIQSALKAGINFIDTSPWYGSSEDVIGLALQQVPRNAYYIATKAGRFCTPTWEGRFAFDRQSILRSVERSLQRLGLDYVDIIQAHDVEFCLDRNVLLKETLPALESIVRAGKAKFIGITGYCLDTLKQISEQIHFDTILTYCRYNFHDRALENYVKYFQAKNIGIINAAPLSMGLLSSNGPPAWHPANYSTREAALKASALAKSKGTTLECEALRFGFHPDIPIATTLVSIPTKQILEENLEIATSRTTSFNHELHQEFQGAFGNTNNDWVGKDIEDYKSFIENS